MLANGTIKTIEDEDDIYISLTALCEYFTKSVVSMRSEIDAADTKPVSYTHLTLPTIYSV